MKTNNKQKVLLFDFPGHPFQYELSEKLSTYGDYKVFHLYNAKQVGPKSSFKKKEGLDVIQVNKNFSKNFYKRFFDEMIYSFMLCYNVLKIKPNTIISSNCPLIPQLFIFLTSRILNIKFIFWLQDIISIAAKEILKKEKNFLQKFVSYIFFRIEFFVLKKSEHIVTISEDFDTILINNGVSQSKITCIPNWAPLDDIPLHDKSNSFSKKHNLDQSFNILYSGTLGFKHNPDVILKLSKFLIQNKIGAKIIIVSEGEVVDFLKHEAKKNSLQNILFLPFQDFSLFPQVLATADISLVMLEKSAGQFSVPSKLLSILCSGRIPLVFVSKSNLSSRIVLNNKCGLSVDSQGDLNNSIKDIHNNIQDFEFMSKNARLYAENNFNIDKISKKFSLLIG